MKDPAHLLDELLMAVVNDHKRTAGQLASRVARKVDPADVLEFLADVGFKMHDLHPTRARGTFQSNLNRVADDLPALQRQALYELAEFVLLAPDPDRAVAVVLTQARRVDMTPAQRGDNLLALFFAASWTVRKLGFDPDPDAGTTAGGPDLPPAAWYPDPADPSRLRYWDGADWTTHIASRTPAGTRY